jgi:hypothetical protein
MEDKEMAGRLWELANLLTAFSAAQSLATLFAVVRGDLDKWLVDWKAHKRSFWGTILFSILYEIAVIYCGYQGARLDCVHVELWWTFTAGRLFAVLLFGFVLGVVIWGHWEFVKANVSNGASAKKQ